MMKKIFISIIIVFTIFSLSLIFVLKPYESLHEQRISTDKIVVLTEFINVTGNPACTKLYAIESVSSIEKGAAIFPATPKSIQSPDDGEYAYANNKFKLTGYPYEWVYRNAITGTERRERSQRFDVVEWEIIAPYTIWLEQQGENGEPLTEQRTIPIKYEISGDQYPVELFRMDNYIDCLAN